LAIQVELSTVPPYLYALHSIADQSSEAALLIRSIVVEEMLHAALATNLLLAVGGEPQFDSTDWIPTYPGLLPHHTPPLMVGLEPAGPDVIRDVFMRIEQPEVHGAPPEPDTFETLGQFYHALELALAELNDRHPDLFADPQLARQMGDAGYYSPVEYDAEDSGGLIPVTDLASADEAIEIIVHQGEGLSTERWADPLHQELTHYYKLLEIAEGESPLGDVLPVPANPRVDDYPPEVRKVADLFNATYRYTFIVMHEIFSGTDTQGALVGRLYRLMSDVLAPLANHLVTMPIDGGVAAPTFEVWEFGPDPAAELRAMAATVTGSHADLEGLSEVFDAVCSGS
jgi:hypothetical protein